MWDESAKKTPLGITPKKIHKQSRIIDILSAMERYTRAGMIIPVEWINELQELNQEVK